MKLITAIIKEIKMDQVREALYAAEINRITVSRGSGHGQLIGEEIYRGQKVAPNLIPNMILQIAVNDDFVQITVDAIIKGSQSEGGGVVGDGKIFVTQLEDCIRIRTGERGSEAI